MQSLFFLACGTRRSVIRSKSGGGSVQSLSSLGPGAGRSAVRHVYGKGSMQSFVLRCGAEQPATRRRSEGGGPQADTDLEKDRRNRCLFAAGQGGPNQTRRNLTHTMLASQAHGKQLKSDSRFADKVPRKTRRLRPARSERASCGSGRTPARTRPATRPRSRARASRKSAPTTCTRVSCGRSAS